MRCSADSKRRDVEGYSTFTSSIMQFSELDELPMAINLRSMDERSGIEATMANRAQGQMTQIMPFQIRCHRASDGLTRNFP